MAYSLPRVALETTLLLHGVPAADALPLFDSLVATVKANGAHPRALGLFDGQPVDGLTRCQLAAMLAGPAVAKTNTATLGALMAKRAHGATTVSTTMELAASRGIRLFATGGIGGAHKQWATHGDISADLAALARFPVAVVTSGCKSILDVLATREMLETLGVPVIGYQTSSFPAFYQRDGGCDVDARFDDAEQLGRYCAHELARTGRGIVIASPVPEAEELAPDQFALWLSQAEEHAAARGAVGRAVTPIVLGALHQLSGGATLRANIALVQRNCEVAAQVAVHTERMD